MAWIKNKSKHNTGRQFEIPQNFCFCCVPYNFLYLDGPIGFTGLCFLHVLTFTNIFLNKNNTISGISTSTQNFNYKEKCQLIFFYMMTYSLDKTTLIISP